MSYHLRHIISLDKKSSQKEKGLDWMNPFEGAAFRLPPNLLEKRRIDSVLALRSVAVANR